MWEVLTGSFLCLGSRREYLDPLQYVFYSKLGFVSRKQGVEGAGVIGILKDQWKSKSLKTTIRSEVG
jgi:hypothetical protein